MKIILIILKKELLQIMRNRQMLPIIFIMPIIQLIILVQAATFEISNINFTVVDNSRSTLTKELVNKIASSRYYSFLGYSNSFEQAEKLIAQKKVDMALVFDSNFEKSVYSNSPAVVQMLINSEDGMMAGTINSYTNQIVFQFSKDLSIKLIGSNPSIQNLATEELYYYNPELNYHLYMVPGILAILVTMIGMFLAGMNIVKEKEIGTIEQLNVTPIKKYQFIIGKLLPFWTIGLFELAFGMLISYWLYDIVIQGSILLIFGVSAVYLIAILAIGLLISTMTNTQQQAMFISWFFAVLFILLSGLFTPLQSMPDWARLIAQFNPVTHFVEVMRRIILKGSGFEDIQYQAVFLLFFAIVLTLLAIWRFRKTV